MADVPRASDMTGKSSAAESAAQREWRATRKQFQSDRAKFAFGSKEAISAWKQRIRRTRSA